MKRFIFTAAVALFGVFASAASSPFIWNPTCTSGAYNLFLQSCLSTSGSGTVTSVGLTLPNIFSVSGSPIITSGTLAGTLATQSAHAVFTGPSSGAAAAPTFRALVSTDIPSLSYVSSVALTVPTFLSISGSPITTSGTLAVSLSGTALPVTNGGTGSTTAFTTGSIVFSGASGTYLQDNANFFWDSTNHRLGIGTTSPSFGFDIVQDTSSATQVIQQTGYGTNNIGWRGRHARGTAGSPTATQSGDFLSFISGRGYGDTGFPAASTANMNFLATANFTDSSMPTAVVFQTTPSGSVTAAEAMRVAPSGNLLIGTATDGTGKLQVNGTASVTTANVSGLTASLPVFTDGSKNLATQSVATARVSLGIQSYFTFLTSGTTWTSPATSTGFSTSTLCKFTLIGGGGGGAGTSTTINTHAAGGGAGATVIVFLNSLTPNNAYTIAIGAAGAGATGNTGGGNGGNTTLTVGATTYTAGGGAGPLSGSGDVAGGVGGTATNGTIPINGQFGQGIGIAASSVSSGFGGDSLFGLGGSPVFSPTTGSTNGNAASGYGGGGGGGATGNATGTAANGGAGTQGAILIECAG